MDDYTDYNGQELLYRLGFATSKHIKILHGSKDIRKLLNVYLRFIYKNPSKKESDVKEQKKTLNLLYRGKYSEFLQKFEDYVEEKEANRTYLNSARNIVKKRLKDNEHLNERSENTLNQAVKRQRELSHVSTKRARVGSSLGDFVGHWNIYAHERDSAQLKQLQDSLVENSRRHGNTHRVLITVHNMITSLAHGAYELYYMYFLSLILELNPQRTWPEIKDLLPRIIKQRLSMIFTAWEELGLADSHRVYIRFPREDNGSERIVCVKQWYGLISSMERLAKTTNSIRHPALQPDSIQPLIWNEVGDSALLEYYESYFFKEKQPSSNILEFRQVLQQEEISYQFDREWLETLSLRLNQSLAEYLDSMQQQIELDKREISETRLKAVNQSKEIAALECKGRDELECFIRHMTSLLSALDSNDDTNDYSPPSHQEDKDLRMTIHTTYEKINRDVGLLIEQNAKLKDVHTNTLTNLVTAMEFEDTTGSILAVERQQGEAELFCCPEVIEAYQLPSMITTLQKRLTNHRQEISDLKSKIEQEDNKLKRTEESKHEELAQLQSQIRDLRQGWQESSTQNKLLSKELNDAKTKTSAQTSKTDYSNELIRVIMEQLDTRKRLLGHENGLVDTGEEIRLFHSDPSAFFTHLKSALQTLCEEENNRELLLFQNLQEKNNQLQSMNLRLSQVEIQNHQMEERMNSLICAQDVTKSEVARLGLVEVFLAWVLGEQFPVTQQMSFDRSSWLSWLEISKMACLPLGKELLKLHPDKTKESIKKEYQEIYKFGAGLRDEIRDSKYSSEIYTDNFLPYQKILQYIHRIRNELGAVQATKEKAIKDQSLTSEKYAKDMEALRSMLNETKLALSDRQTDIEAISRAKVELGAKLDQLTAECGNLSEDMSNTDKGYAEFEAIRKAYTSSNNLNELRQLFEVSEEVNSCTMREKLDNLARKNCQLHNQRLVLWYICVQELVMRAESVSEELSPAVWRTIESIRVADITKDTSLTLLSYKTLSDQLTNTRITTLAGAKSEDVHEMPNHLIDLEAPTNHLELYNSTQGTEYVDMQGDTSSNEMDIQKSQEVATYEILYILIGGRGFSTISPDLLNRADLYCTEMIRLFKQLGVDLTTSINIPDQTDRFREFELLFSRVITLVCQESLEYRQRQNDNTLQCPSSHKLYQLDKTYIQRHRDETELRMMHLNAEKVLEQSLGNRPLSWPMGPVGTGREEREACYIEENSNSYMVIVNAKSWKIVSLAKISNSQVVILQDLLATNRMEQIKLLELFHCSDSNTATHNANALYHFHCTSRNIDTPLHRAVRFKECELASALPKKPSLNGPFYASFSVRYRDGSTERVSASAMRRWGTHVIHAMKIKYATAMHER